MSGGTVVDTQTSGWSALEQWEADALLVARAPEQPGSHAHRIRHAIERGDRGVLIAALVDLWLADVAPQVRLGLLAEARPVLDRGVRRVLESSASDGLDQSHPLARAPRSVLSAGVTGTTILVTPAAPTPPQGEPRRGPGRSSGARAPRRLMAAAVAAAIVVALVVGLVVATRGAG